MCSVPPPTDPNNIDNDGDDYTENQGDCNDYTSKIHLYASEICEDGLDQNCDGKDTICPENIDNDGDGYTENQSDCDDSSSIIFPSAIDKCGDGVDQDCDEADRVCPTITPILLLLLNPRDDSED